MLRISVAVLVGLFTIPSSAGDLPDGNDLLSLCRTSDGNHADWCQGFVEGVYLGVRWESDEVKDMGRPFCTPPEGVKSSQLVAVIRKYLSDHPERFHHEAHLLVVDALHEAFPCRQRDHK